MLQRLRISRSRSTGPHCRELMPVSGYQPSLGLSLRGHIRCLLLHHCSLPHHGESRLFPDIVRQFAINPNPPPLDYARFPLGSRTAGPRVSSRQIHPSPVALTLSNATSVLSRARRRSISAKTMPKCSIARPVSLSPSMDSRRLMTSTWISLSQPSSYSNSVTERPGGQVSLPLHSHRGLEPPSGDSNRAGSKRARSPRPRRPPHSRPRRDAESPGFGVNASGYRHAGVSVGVSAHLSPAPGSGMVA